MKKLLIAFLFIVSLSFFVRAADDTDDDVQCPEGRIYNATVESCVPCPPGTFAPYAENKVCKPCPEGTVAPKQGSGKCSECRAGAYEIGDRLSCYLCGRGTYSLARQTGCTQCPEGSIAAEEGQAESCTRCSTAFYEVNRRSCVRCPAGYMSPFGSTKDDCYQCPAGTVLTLKAKTSKTPEMYECQKCKAGTYEVDRATCETCPKGYTSTEGSGECTQCHAGSVSSYDRSSCQECPATTFESGRVNCESCPEKMTSKKGSSGKASCTLCPPGTYWGRDFGASYKKMICQQCTPGTYSISSREECVRRCPRGTYANRSLENCETCPDGYFPVADADDCQKCPAGKYGTGGSCYACPDGKSCPEGSTNSSQCVACERGYVASGSECQKCPAGQIPTIWYGSYCENCEIGTYKFNDTTCMRCPNGTVAAKSGATQCTHCPSGLVSSRYKTSCVTQAAYEKEFAPKESETSTSRGINPLFYAVGAGSIALLLYVVVVRRNKKQTHDLNFEREEQVSLQAADYQSHTYA